MEIFGLQPMYVRFLNKKKLKMKLQNYVEKKHFN